MLYRPDSVSWPLATAPDHISGTLGHVFPAAARALGRDLTPGTQLPDLLDGAGPGSLRGIVVLLVDGLGAKLLRERRGYTRFLRTNPGSAHTLHTSFPSTTTTALGFLGTGELAGNTGLVGYTGRNPASGELAHFIKWSGLPPADQWQKAPQFLSEFAAQGGRAIRVGQQKFSRSELSRAILWTETYHSATKGPQRIKASLESLQRATKEKPALVYLYWGELDQIGHRAGTDSLEWGEALAALDAAVAELVQNLPKGTGLLLTADHGMIAPDLDQQLDIQEEPELARDLTLVAGEPRALHLYCAAENVEAVADRWRRRLEHRAQVHTQAEATALGWFGSVRPEVSGVLGDVIVAMNEAYTVVDSRIHTPEAQRLLGVHGSLTDAETEVPLLWFAN